MIRFLGSSVEGLVLRPYGGYPLGPFMLPLDPGLTVLYGPNGAGKSLVLEALHGCVTGVVTDRTALGMAGLLVSDLWPDEVALGLSTRADPMPDLSVDAEVAWLAERLRALFLENWTRQVARLSDDERSALPSVDAPGALFDEFWAHPLYLLAPNYHQWVVEKVLHSGAPQSNLVVTPVVRLAGKSPATEQVLHFEIQFKPELDDQDDRVISTPVQRMTYRLLEPLPGTPPREGESPDRQVQRHDLSGHPVGLALGSSWVWDPYGGNARLPIWFPQMEDPDSTTVAYLASRSPRRDWEVDDWRWSPNQREWREAFESQNGRAFDATTDGSPFPFWLESDKWGDLTASSGLVTALDRVEGRANHLYGLLLLNAPELAFWFGGPTDWFKGRRPHWLARRSEDHRLVPLSDLSAAERKWANIAISVALHFADLDPNHDAAGLLLIDEPEAGLHRTAEAHMARGLTELVRAGFSVVAASHSPEVLNVEDAHVWHVRRRATHVEDSVQIAPLSHGVEATALEELGLRPADLIGMQRGFLIVEGEHDVAVLQAILGKPLRDRRIHILPARGTWNMPDAVSARLLHDFSDAHIFAVVDAVDLRTVRQAWEDAKSQARAGHASAARRIVNDAFGSDRRNEYQFLEEFMTRSLATGVYDRHTPLALSKPDILEYLPIESFLPKEHSWDEVRARAQKALGARPKSSSYKTWLRKHGAGDRLTVTGIRSAASRVTEMPRDFRELLDAIDSVLEEGRFRASGL